MSSTKRSSLSTYPSRISPRSAMSSSNASVVFGARFTWGSPWSTGATTARVPLRGRWVHGSGLGPVDPQPAVGELPGALGVAPVGVLVADEHHVVGAAVLLGREVVGDAVHLAGRLALAKVVRRLP